ncbi:MAG: hypothetical protein JNM78_13660 [Cyclobacteriaceae bacterium]|nr:hypothetical protein [Cyclobacteriaceae bacterium]
MTRCSTGKRLYSTEQVAENSLIEAHIHFEYKSGAGPKAVYKCDECGAYHLTSQGVMNVRLSQLLADGTIQKQKEAGRWNDKFKKH